MEALGASWVVLEALFFMLVFGVVFNSALGGVWPGFWIDFNGFWEDFGKILGRFWEGFGRNLQAFWVILGLCGLFWAVGAVALLLAVAFFVWFCLPLPCPGFLGLLCLFALSVPVLLRFPLMLAHFSLLWLIFSNF